MPCRFPGPHPRGKFREIWLGGLQAHSQGGSSGGSGQGGVCFGGCVPVPGGVELLLWAVRILLECILVQMLFFLNSVAFVEYADLRELADSAN